MHVGHFPVWWINIVDYIHVQYLVNYYISLLLNALQFVLQLVISKPVIEIYPLYLNLEI